MNKFFTCLSISSIILIAMASSALAKDIIYCDYYDKMGDFVLTFDKSIKLGPSGESNTSGITFVFSEDSNLIIYGTPSAYDISDISADRKLPLDVELFVDEYNKNGCAEYAINANTRKILCNNNIYILRLVHHKKILICIYTLYNAKTNDHDDTYNKIIDSIVLFEDDIEREKAREIVMEAGWPNYNEDNPYEQPRLFCGKNRIRSLLEGMIKNSQ